MRDLTRLLQPRSVAVVGGGAVCGFVIENCRKFGFDGPIWAVHPTRDSVAETPAFRSIADLPGVPDATFIGVNRHASLDVVRALAACGAGGAVVYASGFAEAIAETADGADMQAALLDAAGHMPIIGPNCYGFVNYLDGAALWPDQQGGTGVARGVALITQSSNIAINLTMQRRGLPLAYVVTVGNQAQLGLAEVGRALLCDDRVTALGLHIEGIGDIRGFEALAQAAQASGKPIVAVKAGRSDQARRAAVSHTASLAGSDAGAQALLDRLGIARAGGLSAMLEALKILHLVGRLDSTNVAAMSCSGGEASLIADLGATLGLEFPALTPARANGLRMALGPKVALANPLDYHTYIWADAPAMTRTFTAMMASEHAIGVVVADFPRSDRCKDADWEPVIEAVRAARIDSGRPMAILSGLAENMPESHADRLMTAGVVPLCGMESGLEAVGLAAKVSAPAAAPIILPIEPGSLATLDEAAGKALVAPYGLDVPKGYPYDMNTVRQCIDTITFPVAIKGQGIAHKTEAGAVVLGLKDAEATLAAARAMPSDRFLIEEMIADPVAELLLGVVRDPAHGMVLTLGAGGILAEIVPDHAHLLLPVGENDIRQALQELVIYKVLSGYRGRASANIDAILDAVLAVQAFCLANTGRIEEIEINPLICTPYRAVAADILITMERP